MTFYLPLTVVLVLLAALLSLALDLASASERRDKERRNPTPQQLPADDLIGRNLRDVR